MKVKTLILATVLCMTVTTTSAHAISRVASAKAAALAYWGHLACPATFLIMPLPGTVVAQASVTGWVPGDECTISLNSAILGKGQGYGYEFFCATIVHEYGHLNGFHEDGGPDNGIHSADPRNIMYPTVTSRNLPTVCRSKQYVHYTTAHSTRR